MVTVLVIILLIIGIIISIICNICTMSDDDRGFRIATSIVILILGFFLGMTTYGTAIPTIEDYIHGKVKLEVKQTVEDGVVVKCDTIYYYK